MGFIFRWFIVLCVFVKSIFCESGRFYVKGCSLYGWRWQYCQIYYFLWPAVGYFIFSLTEAYVTAGLNPLNYVCVRLCMCPKSQVVLAVGFIVLGSCSEAAFFAALSFGQLF